ncbi:MAG: PAC2 family protein [Actinobacteria bacterium]|nr:PAC2 family protein [Actinomycetota bacterium]
MEVTDVLEWRGVSTPLRRPVLVVAMSGWFDVAQTATKALIHVIDNNESEEIGSIDADPFYDFTQVRPEARLDDDGDRMIVWPANDITAVRFPNSVRDVVVMTGTEPHVRWRTYVRCLIATYTRLGCEAIVTVGAAADAVPHTRVPPVVGSTVDPVLARTLGLSRPSYQGITGVAGVLQEQFEREELPAISLRVGVPHYLGNAEHPQSSAALLRHLEHVLGVPTRHADFADDIDRWRTLHDDAVAEDDKARHYVRMLETEFDRRAEAELLSGDDLAAEFQKFLDERRNDD